MVRRHVGATSIRVMLALLMPAVAAVLGCLIWLVERGYAGCCVSALLVFARGVLAMAISGEAVMGFFCDPCMLGEWPGSDHHCLLATTACSFVQLIMCSAVSCKQRGARETACKQVELVCVEACCEKGVIPILQQA